MGSVLITGATGFVGSRLVERLCRSHDVIAMSRTKMMEGPQVTIQGSFASDESLHLLDKYKVDAVVHLAAEVGGCSEEAGLQVNVCGTRTLLRYLVDRGCSRYFLASSIAATGALSPDFVPHELPISDDYSSEAVDAYGLSKSLMEEVAFYFHRVYPEAQFTIFRLGAILDNDAGPVTEEGLVKMPFPFVDLGAVSIEDVLGAFERAIDLPAAPGIARMNLVSAWARTPVPVPTALQRLFGDRVKDLDLSHYLTCGDGSSSVYSIVRLHKVLGFVPSIDVRTMTRSGDW